MDFDLRLLTVTELNIMTYLVEKRDSLLSSAEEFEKFRYLFRQEAFLLDTIIYDINTIIEERKK